MLSAGAWDWNAIYLTCFGVGLLLSVLAFVGGFGHLHFGHFHLRAHHGLGKTGSAHIAPVNGFTLVAFLCWFGGTGYLLHRGGVFSGLLVLLFSALSGVAGGSLVFWFMSKVLMGHERPLLAADTELTGMIGRLSTRLGEGATGEMLYSQNGARRSVTVRAEDGAPIERGTEVIVMRYVRGTAWIRRWDEFEHGLLGGEQASKSEGEQRR